MAREIPKAYEPQEIEKRWAQAWFEQKLYRAEESAPGPVFSIVLPPPNVTGSIHIGHMLEHTQIDILVRWRRMSGRRTLWLPGMDHAGIGTQFVVERELAKEGLTRQKIGREEFERRVWKWKEESGGAIKQQMIRLGVSCDWTRERFTLEPALYRAVLEEFLRLYREGLIYRGRYIVNWCPRCQTAISDLETVHAERAGKLWYIRYPIVDSQQYIVVATTRPETMLGDTAVAVHPEDERYKHLIGEKVLLPLMKREIPIIADDVVNREFGTGAVKVTPAHDPNDFEIGRRHHLHEIDVMTNDAHMSKAAGKYAGLGRFAAREEVVKDLKALGLLDRIENHTHSVGTCDRCKTDIEPRLSVQWFCKMKPLAEPAIRAVREELIAVVPDNQRKILLNWLDNIRDWCISRQLWWGHRIPIWHCADCKAMVPARDSRVAVVDGHAQAASPPEKCPACGSNKLKQDPDVLDTWFSSCLWPFSTLGWPDETDDLRTFYPTSLLISGYDILFFWDVRMIMMGLHLVERDKIEQRIPFRELYLHAIVRDPHGIKMSKTRGNVVDPLEIADKHGTDALRFALAVMSAPGTDIALSEDRILSYRAFANKIWNAARFLFVNLDKIEATGAKLEDLAAPEIRAGAPYKLAGQFALADRWIFSRLAAVTAEIGDALETFRLHEAAHVVYHFFWGDFCDWYIEWVKPKLDPKDREAAVVAWRNLFAVFESALRLLHPFMPFLTEELWHKLPQRASAKSIALERFPDARAEWSDNDAEWRVQLLQQVITTARSLRSDTNIGPKEKVRADIHITPMSANVESRPTVGGVLSENLETVLRLSSLSDLKQSAEPFDPGSGVIRSSAEFDLRLPLFALQEEENESGDRNRAALALQVKITRLKKEIEDLRSGISAKEKQLQDQDFLTRAPQKVVQVTRVLLSERQAMYDKLIDQLAQLEKAAGHSA